MPSTTSKRSFESQLLATLKKKKKNATKRDVNRILKRVLKSVGDSKSKFN